MPSTWRIRGEMVNLAFQSQVFQSQVLFLWASSGQPTMSLTVCCIHTNESVICAAGMCMVAATQTMCHSNVSLLFLPRLICVHASGGLDGGLRV